jgi:hypothetical protein
VTEDQADAGTGAAPAVQVPPLDVDGVGAVAIGTAAWAVALVVLLLVRPRLAESGSEWWIWVALTGLLLGLLGLGYTTRRRAAYRKAR